MQKQIPKCYVLVNQDLKMGKGKIIAQTAHAIADMIRAQILDAKNVNSEYLEWKSTGETVIALKCTQQFMRDLCLIKEAGVKQKKTLFPVYDEGRTQVEPGSLTVIATLPIGNDHAIAKALAACKLL